MARDSGVRIDVVVGDHIPGVREIVDLVMEDEDSGPRSGRKKRLNALHDEEPPSPASQHQHEPHIPLYDSDDEDEDGTEDKPMNYFIGVSERVKGTDSKVLDWDQDTDETAVNYLESEEAASDLKGQNRQLFPHLFLLLHEKFNLVLYGFGSKRNLLNNFCATFLRDEHYLLINGYFPALTAKDVANNMRDALEAESSDTESILQAVDLLDDTFYLVIHSIDMLFASSSKIKSLVVDAVIRSQGSIRLIGTVDHVNSGLLFDSTEKVKMDLMWIHVPTFNPYTIERGYAGSATAATTDSDITLSSVLRVYESLTPNAQKIFLLVLDYYVDKKKQLLDEKQARKEAALLLRQQKNDKKKQRKQKSRRKRKVEEEDEEEETPEEEDDVSDEETNNRDGHKSKSGRMVDSSENLPFSVLYRMCREQYLVNSEITLKAQLIEFQDHHIMRVRKASDGTPVVRILMHLDLAQSFLNKIRDV